MGSLLDLVRQLRQGIWASLTGGWYYDPYHKIFTNTVHLYLWLFFLCLPFSIHLYIPSGSWLIWIYNGSIFFAFLTLKAFNRTLHKLFDKGEVFEVTEGDSADDIENHPENIELQDMSGGVVGGLVAGGGSSGSTGGRLGTPDPRRRINMEQTSEGRTEADLAASSSSRFDLKVDVHSKPETAAAMDDVDSGTNWSLPRPEEVIDIDKDKGDVVILVGEGGGSNAHTAHSQTVLEETKQSGVSFDASQCEVSFSTTSSQLTMPGVPRVDGNRRYSNMSNLARSIRSEPGSGGLEPVTGSLEMLASLDANISQLGKRRRSNQNKSGRNVRRTKSVLDTGLGCVAPLTVASYPVSLDTVVKEDFRQKGKSGNPVLKTLELLDSQISEASEEGSSKDIEATKRSVQDIAFMDNEEEADLDKLGPSQADDDNGSVGSGVYMQMAEIDVDDKPQLILEDSDDGDDGHCAAHEDAGSGQEGFDSVKLTEIGSSNDWDTSTTAEQTINNGDDQGLDVKLEEIRVDIGLVPTDVKPHPGAAPAKSVGRNLKEDGDGGETAHELAEATGLMTAAAVGPGETAESTTAVAEAEEAASSLLSTVGLDWLFSDSEPEEAPSSPKQVPLTEDRAVRVQELSSAPRPSGSGLQRISSGSGLQRNSSGSSQARSAEPTPAKSRDSSHGSSGTDTETRALLNKLDEVEASIQEACGGAIPKRRLRGASNRRRGSRQRSEAEPTTSSPVTTSLQDDAAGLKLFLDLLNGPDSSHPEAEAELRKLIEQKRLKIEDEASSRAGGPKNVRRGLAIRRKRRHAAEPQTEERFPPTAATEEAFLALRETSRRRKDRAKDDKEPHLAQDHEDTSAGAVHCFQDEHGNWQTYTFGGHSQTSSHLSPVDTSGPLSSSNLGSLLQRQFSGESSSSRRPSSRPAGEETGSGGRASNSTSTDPNALYLQSNSSSDSGLTVILDSPAMVFQPNVDRQRSRDSASDSFWTPGSAAASSTRENSFWSRENSTSGRYNVTTSSQTFRRYNPLSMLTENLFDRLPGQNINTTLNQEMIPYSPDGSGPLPRLEEGSVGRVNLSTSVHLGTGSIHSATPKVRKYHLLKIPGTRGVKVWLDRLQLLNIMDQDPSLLHTLLAILLGTTCAILGSQVIQEGYFKDLLLVLFCLVLCSSQYSLIKSVQPDASSPTHGFNTTTVYSRPVYFIIMCSIVLILENTLKGEVESFELYGLHWGERHHLEICRDVVYGLILAFPVIFTLGLLPQINTAAMFILEQIDIHVFGGNASSSIQASFYCIVRSVIANVILVGFAYGGLTERTHSAHAQQVLFSIFCSLSVPLSYHLSRASSDPTVVLSILKRHILAIVSEDTPVGSPGLESPDPPTPVDDPTVPKDPLPKKLRDTVNSRLKNDLIVSVLSAVLVFLVVQSGVFEKTQPHMDIVLWCLALLLGVLLHYILPHLRKENPWKCIAAPVLKSQEHGQFEVHHPAAVMWWEKCQLWAVTIEKSVLFPAIFLSAVYQDKAVFSSLFGLWGGSLLMSVSLLKCLRICFSDSSRQYVVLLLAVLIFQYNPSTGKPNNLVVGEVRRSPFLLDYFLTSILVLKLQELYLKSQFVITYTAPHQINWGSAFHAFAQPFSVPHSAMLFLQAAVSSALSSPLNPFLGSTIFLCSYARPVKFWERNYNTKRVDNSNTRLSSQVEMMRNPGADDNNLNSIFYEHLTRSLQHSLAGDIMLGRWGEVQQGDFFVLASDYLNCLVHIIELGNGLCTFQVRGLEFRGTYCHQREVEAISEGLEDDEACCCCEPGHLPYMLSLNAALSQRWLAWEVSAVKYVLEGYSISDNSAQSMLQVYDLRKILVSYYIKSIIYYTVRSPKLSDWLANPAIRDAIKATSVKCFVDLDPLFNSNIDEDFDFRASGITRSSFCNIYLGWIQHCAKARDRNMPAGKDSDLVSLCLALSVLGRRALGAAGHNALSTVEFFLVGLHALFKGDFRITSVRDEWVFSDMELLRRVVAPGVRMSLKLHQDHFMSPDEYEDPGVLYEAITSHEQDLVISHEGDPAWRTAVLAGAPSLLALRHVVDDGSDEYKIIMLNKRFLSFRVIKLNRECVRGLWAGQQQELIFLRNRNPERGSIQNAKQALRNIINSSCDQPLGYPIYVSPLMTSYSDTNQQVSGVLGGPLSLGAFKKVFQEGWDRVRDKCAGSCSSGSAGVDCDINTGDCVLPEHLRGGSLPGNNRASVVSSVSKPSSGTLVSLAGLLGSQSLPLAGSQASEEGTGTPSVKAKKRSSPVYPVVRILDPLMVYDNINLGRRIDPVWPDPEWRAKGGRNSWGAWIPVEEMKGLVVHRWSPSHPHPMYRSHTDKTILLVKIEDKYVPIAEHAVEIIFQDQGPDSAAAMQSSPAVAGGLRSKAESSPLTPAVGAAAACAANKSPKTRETATAAVRAKSTPPPLSVVDRSQDLPPSRVDYPAAAPRRTKEGILGVRIMDPLIDEEKAVEALKTGEMVEAENADSARKAERLELKKASSSRSRRESGTQTVQGRDHGAGGVGEGRGDKHGAATGGSGGGGREAREKPSRSRRNSKTAKVYIQQPDHATTTSTTTTHVEDDAPKPKAVTEKLSTHKERLTLEEAQTVSSQNQPVASQVDTQACLPISEVSQIHMQKSKDPSLSFSIFDDSRTPEPISDSKGNKTKSDASTDFEFGEATAHQTVQKADVSILGVDQADPLSGQEDRIKNGDQLKESNNSSSGQDKESEQRASMEE